jgi:Na+-driven multidrug efflux pump
VGIRVLSMRTILLAGMLQAALLGARESVTPPVVVAASTVLNVCGDLLCVVGLGMGCRGTAIGTLLARWIRTM